MIQLAMVELPIGSDVHKDALRASELLSKNVNMGKETEGITQTGVGQLLQQIARQAMMARSQGQGAQGPPAMPPTQPLPGA